MAFRKQIRVLAGCSKLNCGLILAKGKSDVIKNLTKNMDEEVVVVLSSNS